MESFIVCDAAKIVKVSINMKLYTKWTRLLIMNESLSIPVFYFVLFTQKKTRRWRLR